MRADRFLSCWLAIAAGSAAMAVTSIAAAFQSCPDPLGYAANAPMQLKKPGFWPIMSFRVGATPIPITGSYRPADLLGWTASPSACTVSSAETSPCASHRVYLPGAQAAWREPLVVFLPGSSMEPDKHDLVLKTAAYAGYRTIGLSYDNTHNVDTLCVPGGVFQSCATDCYASKRDEVISGEDLTVDFEIQPADSIVERLFTLLAQLYADDIGDGTDDYGWDAYFTPVLAVPYPITAANIRWDKIIIAGFSQGAGHAARISATQAVQGAVMIDGPGDLCTDGIGNLVAAPWLDGADASVDRPRYGVMHAVWRDLLGLAADEAPATWTALGLAADGVADLDPPPSRPPLPGPTLPPGLPTDIGSIGVLLPPAHAAYTAQSPATKIGSGTGPDSGCLPPDLVQKHGSMADDRCMPTTTTSGLLATTPPQAFLFKHYLKRFCYACEPGVCP